MNKSLSTTSRCFAHLLLTGVLLIVLFLSSGAGARVASQVGQKEGQPETISIRFAPTLPRTHALTTFQSPRTVTELARHRVIHPGIIAERFGALMATARQRLVSGNRPVFYFSLRFAQPLGRAPPLPA